MQQQQQQDQTRTWNREETKRVNYDTCMNLFHLLKSSLGPLGFDKLMQNELGEVTLTNDGATILDNLALKEPAARLLLDLSLSQDDQSGDGTSSVVLVACELLRLCTMLMDRQGIELDVVLDGLTLAREYVVTLLAQRQKKGDKSFSEKELEQLAQQILHSKYVRFDREHFASLAVKALMSNSGFENKPMVFKILVPTGSMSDSFLVRNSIVIDIDQVTSPLSFSDHKQAKIENVSTKQLLLLMDNRSKGNIIGPRYKKLYSVESTIGKEYGKSDDIAESPEQEWWDAMVEKRAGTSSPLFIFMSCPFPYRDIAVPIDCPAHIIDCLSKENIKSLKHLCNLDTLELMETVENEEESDNVDADSFDSSFSLEVRTIGNKFFLLIAKQPKPSSSTVNTVVIHGPSDIIVQEINRALHDALSVIEKLLYHNQSIPEEDKTSISDIVGGGGNVEVNLWKALNEYSLTIYNSKIQLVLRAFADALLIIPRQLLASVCRPQEIEYDLSQLKLAHKNSQCEWCEMGIDVTSKNRLCSVIEKGIIDSLQTKMSMIQLATEACIMLLRIDESIYCLPSIIQRKS